MGSRNRSESEAASLRRSTRATRAPTYQDQGTSGDSEEDIASYRSSRLTQKNIHKRKNSHLDEPDIYTRSRRSTRSRSNTRISSRWSPKSQRHSSRLGNDSKVNYYEPPGSPHYSRSSDEHEINSGGPPQRHTRTLTKNTIYQSTSDEDSDLTEVRTGDDEDEDDDADEQDDEDGENEEKVELMDLNESKDESMAADVSSQNKHRAHSFHGDSTPEKSSMEPVDRSAEVEMELASGSIVDAVGNNMDSNNPARMRDNSMNIDDADINSDSRSFAEPTDDASMSRRPGLRPRPRIQYGGGRDPSNSGGNSRPYNLRNNRHSSYGPDSARDIIKLAQLEEQYNRLRHLENFTHSQKKRNFGHMLSNKGGASEEEESERIMPLNARQLNGRGRGLLRKGKGVSSGTANLADIDPVAVNEEVGFSSIGGLDSHIQSLKEMVLLPLLYPEIYTQFSITPPRGVLFYGPPGTGKTLVARALANSCSTESQKVAFFMRKGADCLSKWVGEAERQLRLLFEEAKAWQPSIIFFDEIDGLAPVRSSKQEQVHSSIVSTLLALMDGLDNRGQVVVIGATNRIDAIDPALRRPGRFDREFYFSLPNQVARRTIIDINTKKWNPPISEELKDRLAVMTKGYGGADLKALSTEAALKAIRRKYPQIYDSDEKLLIEPKNIQITAADFLEAIKTTIPCSQRSSPLQANPLPTAVKPLLTNAWENIIQILEPLIKNLKGKKNPRTSTDAGVLTLGELNDEEHYRPRLLISGESGMGQVYLGPAILNHLEDFHVYSFDTASLFGDESGTPETKCVHLFHEVKRHKPCVVYVPSIDHWWRSITDSMRNTFFSLLKDINPYDPIIFIATCDSPLSSLPSELLRMSDFAHRKNVNLRMPSKQSRELFFKTLIQDITKSPKITEPIVSEPIPPLPLAPKPAPREPTEEERGLLKEHDEHVFRELRISLRSVTEELFKERKYKIFFKSVDPEEYPDYYFKVSEPMDLSTIMEKINLGQYRTVKEYLRDIDLIVGNTELYFGAYDQGKNFYRAKSLEDVAYAMVERIDPELIEEAEQSASRYYHEAPTDSEIRKSPLGRSSTTCQVDDGRSDIKSVTDMNNPVGALTPAGTSPSGSNAETLMKEVGNEEATSPLLLPSPLPSTVPDRVSLSPEPSKEQSISDERMDEDIQCKQVIWDPSKLVLLEKHIIEKTEEFNVEELDELRVRLYNILKMNLHHSDRNLVIKNMLNEIDLTVAQIGLLESEEISQFY